MTRAEAKERREIERATLALDVLSAHIGGLTTARWEQLSGLSTSQLRAAKNYINDLFEGRCFVKVWRGKQWIFTLLENAPREDVLEHEERHLRTQITRARREHNLFHKIAMNDPTSETKWDEELARQRLAHLLHAYELRFH